MRRVHLKLLILTLGLIAAAMSGCQNSDITSSGSATTAEATVLVDGALASGQLASGMSFRITTKMIEGDQRSVPKGPYRC